MNWIVAALALLISADVLAEPSQELEQTLPMAARTTLPDETVELSLGLTYLPVRNTYHFDGGSTSSEISNKIVLRASASWGLTERLQWIMPFPKFAYRFGNMSGTEVVIAGGVGLGYENEPGWHLPVDAYFTLRRWFLSSHAVSVTWGAASFVSFEGDVFPNLNGVVSAAYSVTLGEVLTLNLRGSASGMMFEESPRFEDVSGVLLGLGGFTLAGRDHPLIAFQATDWLSLGLDGGVAYNLKSKRRTQGAFATASVNF